MKPEKARKIELDPTKISLWKEYFCRFDEGKKDKKEQVSQSRQLILEEENVLNTVSIEQCQHEIDREIEELLEQLKQNSLKIN